MPSAEHSPDLAATEALPAGHIGKEIAAVNRALLRGERVTEAEMRQPYARLVGAPVLDPADLLAVVTIARNLIECTLLDGLDEQFPAAKLRLEAVNEYLKQGQAYIEYVTGIPADTYTGYAPALN